MGTNQNTDRTSAKKFRQRRIFYVSTYAAATIAILITIGALVSGKFQLGYDTDWLEKYAMITDSINYE